MGDIIKNIHWAAGFIEGEGSFCIRKKKSGNYSQVSASQKQKEPLERLQKIFGGAIYTEKTTMYRWQTNGSLARGIAMTLYSLMSPRRKEQIKKMLLLDTSTSKGTLQYEEKMKKARLSRTRNLDGTYAAG